MDWSVMKLLKEVAQDGRFSALIDTGALVTGFSNEVSLSAQKLPRSL